MTKPSDLVVVLPGFLGSRLIRPRPGTHRGETKDELLWDLGLGSLRSTIKLLLAKRFDPPEPADGVRVDGVLSEPAWLPDFFGVDGYTDMVHRLRRALKPDQLVEFAYDWRYSNAESARRFSTFIVPLLEEWQRGRGTPDSRLILVCHSMGGLVARYFCEALGGADLTRQVITFGTPHRGALKALHALTTLKIAKVIDARTITQNWPSVWEMLPQYPCLLGPSGSFVRLHESGLALTSDPRFVAARAFQLSIREPAEARLAAGGKGYDQVAFFGRVQTTQQYAELVDGKVRPITPGTPGVPDRGGDGTVPSFASMPIEWQTTAAALPLLDKHTALATRAAALEHLLNRLDPDDVSGDKSPQIQPPIDVVAGLDDAEPAPPLGVTDIVGTGYALDVPPVIGDDDLVVDVIHPKEVSMRLEIIDHERGVTEFAQARYTRETEERGYVLRAELGRREPGTYTVRTVDPNPVADHVLVWRDDG